MYFFGNLIDKKTLIVINYFIFYEIQKEMGIKYKTIKYIIYFSIIII